MKEFTRWREGWREQLPEKWLERVATGKQPWGVEGHDATGAKWELSVPRNSYVDQHEAAVNKYCPTGTWNDELCSFE
jgi:hypothetical protein